MRQWPVKSYSQLMDLLIGLQSHTVAVIGGPDEAALAAEVIEGSESGKEVINLVGKLTMDELPYVLSRAALFVGNNSGPQHIAAGLGVPTLGIHSGVVDAREWGPLGDKAAAIRLDMSCSPCFIEHAKDCSRGVACLNGLTVGQVFKACTRFLGVGGGQ